MSLEVVVRCDACRSVIAAGPSADAARADARLSGAASPYPGGKDACGNCVRAGRAPRDRHAPLAARHERLSA